MNPVRTLCTIGLLGGLNLGLAQDHTDAGVDYDPATGVLQLDWSALPDHYYFGLAE